MSTTVNNKAGIKPIPVDQYLITSAMVTDYLTNELGFRPMVDYTRWTGPDATVSYVRMRAVFRPEDIEAKDSATDYASRFLAENNADVKFRDTIINTLTPFMYPTNIREILSNPANTDHLVKRGIAGDRAREILRFAKFDYSRKENLWLLYLRPERIIFDMLKDATTDKIDGEASIVRVAGTTSDTIQWLVIVSNKGKAYTSSLDIDTIFKHA